MNSSYIACVGGKSGGHIIPCLTYARTIKKPDQQIIFFSNNTALDYALLKNQADIAHHYTYQLSLANNFIRFFKTLLSMIKTTIDVYKKLKKHRPSLILSTGGLISLPIVVAGWFLRIPCILFELNAVPGKAARACALFATRIHVCFAQAVACFPPHKAFLTSYPLKPEIIDAASTEHVDTHSKKTIVILGGSQGSVSLNSYIKKMVTALPDLAEKISIVHQTGTHDVTDWPTWYAKHHINAITFPFDNNLIPYYQQADLIIARAGAGTLFEIMAFKKKCIIIPLEITQTDHQRDNALAMVQQYPSLCTVVRESDMKYNADLLCKSVLALLQNSNRM